MFGLIVKYVTQEGRRDEFIRVMSEGFQQMDGCHSYILAADPAEDAAVWVTEIWDREDSHDVSMASPRIQDVVARVMPLVARRELRVVTEPLGGQGL